MNPRVSIIIPFYNDPYVGQAITSALEQTYPNVEIIVVDDGSTQHLDQIAPYMNRVHYIGKANGGTASALNHGIRLASGEYIAWLSSDDIFYPHKLSVQIPFMLSRNASISFSAFDLIDEHNRITEYHVGPRFPNVASLYGAMRHGNPINGCTVVAQKEMLLQVGIFHEALPYTHDYDLWVRLILSRVHFHYLDQPLIQYRWHNRMGTLKHRPAIEQEIRLIQSSYAHSLEAYVRELGG
ncbi:glycosyltransferase [Paenibacillus filicis]|uniref:Glycosyltransferase n=1 Tax=Paenibacillus gyeongsangnamensis TaxID=3388067 RepID=A0ABT4Q9T3_9BACL|nr:glycosyltransferase [Paenibacillus filicis]MCZ8513598.1 glycosyltransferase [Paenibacillus filicis]